MNLPRHSVRRPIFTTMVALILIVLGGVSLSRIQIDLLPSIELPTASVRTEYEGASPEVIERLITQIIEEIVATVPGMSSKPPSPYLSKRNVGEYGGMQPSPSLAAYVPPTPLSRSRFAATSQSG